MPNYLTPQYIETKRKEMVSQGIDPRDADRHIASFISRETGGNFQMDFNSISAKNPNQISGLLDFYAYGTTKPSQRFATQMPEKTVQEEPGIFSKLAKGFVDYATAPGEVFGNLGELAGAKLAGRDTTKIKENLSQNLSRSADVARVAIPAAVGVATGGLSIPASMAVSGLAGVGSSLLASGLEKAAGEEQTAGGAAGEAVATGAIDAIFDGATRGLFKLAKPALKAVGKSELGKQVTKVAGRILQTKDADEIAKGVKAIRALDTTGVETFEDLAGVSGKKIKTLLAAQDEVLSAVPDIKPLSAFTVTSQAGKQVVKTNPVASALDGLEELYTKTGAADDLVRIRQMKQAAKYRGLNAKEVNDIAREYGRGFKAFSDATGQPLTSVNAKMYENVRKGVKAASRSMMPNEAAKQADDAISSLITVRELSDDMVKATQQLSNRIEDRNLFQKAVAAIGGGADRLLGRSPSTFFSSLLVRGNVGMKQLNSLQIQEALPKNLAKLQTLLKTMDSMSDDQVIGAMKELLGKYAERGTDSALKAGAGSMINVLQPE